MEKSILRLCLFKSYVAGVILPTIAVGGMM